MYIICFQAAIFKLKFNFYMLRFLLAKKVTRNSSESTSIRNRCREIYSTQLKLGEKRLFSKSTEKYTLLSSLHILKYELLPKHWSYNLPVLFNVKIMLIQSEETLVKFYCFKLQHPEFPAANKIITLGHFFYPLRENDEFPWKGTLANAIFPCNEILATLVMDYYLWHYK